MQTKVIKMNGVTIDDIPQSIMANALSMFDDLQYRSKDALLDLLYGLNDLVIQHLESQGKKATRFYTAKESIRKYNRGIAREHVLQSVYNELLRLEGLGLLKGFGFSNQFKDRIPGNSEFQKAKRG